MGKQQDAAKRSYVIDERIREPLYRSLNILALFHPATRTEVTAGEDAGEGLVSPVAAA